jgi:uncharacterized membrane protein
MEPRSLRRREVGGLVFGAIVLLFGIYFLFRETLGVDLPELDWDQIWPILLIALGGVIVYENWVRRRES